MKILLTILIGGAVLIFYVLMERRVARRGCLTCGAQISVDDVEGKCPRCGSFIEE